MANASTSSSTASASTAASTVGSAVAALDKETSAVTGDSCTWYAGGACLSPRSCYDCINVLIPGDTCGVGSSGECVSTSNSKGATLYTSDDYVYCSDDDDKCAACERAWVTQYQTLGDVLSSSCTGDGGCICLAVCERPTRVNIVVHEQCPVFGGTATRILAFMGIGIGVCLFFAFIAFTTRWFISFCAPDIVEAPPGHRRRLTRRTREPTGPLLTLTGWKAMREQLIDAEQRALDPPARLHDEELDTPARLEVGLPVVTIEEGDGFRPASPSQHAPHARGP